jgi:hypothetical protein
MSFQCPTPIERRGGFYVSLVVGIILLLGNHHVEGFKPRIKNTPLVIDLHSSQSKHPNKASELSVSIRNNEHKWLQIRGGGSEEGDNEDDMPIVAKVFSLLGDTVLTFINIFSNILGSALSSSGGKDDTDSEVESSFDDFGGYLSNAYGCVDINDDDEGEKSRISIEGGSLSRALLKARSNARLLVVFIPASKPTKKKSYDQKAIQSILSSDVTRAAERKARKKESYGSFMIWATKVDSSEASTARKRLKVKPSKKSPTLVVVYPAQTIDSAGRPKITPRVLGQHHCNPPLSPESMSVWLNSLRKRHAKQYAVMHHDLREVAYMKKRNEEYHSSVKEDKERAEKERQEEERRIEEERLQKEKEEALKERRKSLLESLPEEPENASEGVVTIALRFGDGQTGKRRFTDETEIDVLFNWVDAMFEMERERVILTTMNGQKAFSFGEEENKTLQETGLGRLVAFRVSEKQDEEEDADDTNEDDSEKTDDEEE